MAKLTVELDDEVAKRVLDAAAERGVAPEAVAAEAVSERFPPRRRLSFIGMGRSGHTDTARRHDEILWETKVSVTLDPAKLAQARALVGVPTVSELIAVALDRLIAAELDGRHVAGYLEQPPDEEEDSWADAPRDPSEIADDVDWAALYGVEGFAWRAASTTRRRVGLLHDSVANFDSLQLVPGARLRRRIGALSGAKLTEACRALRFATSC